MMQRGINPCRYESLRTAKKYGLVTHAFTMIGLPGEDRNSLNATYELLKKVKPDTVQTTIFYPLPRIRLYENLVGEGLFNPNRPMPSNYYGKSQLNFPERKKRELLRWQFILPNYNSKVVGLYVLYLPQLIFKILVLVRAPFIKFKKEGFFSMLEGIKRYLNRILWE